MEPTLLRFVVLISCVTLVITLLLSKIRNPSYKYPKGPSGIPILGNLLQMIKTPAHLKFSQWAYEFGPLYSIKVGSKFAVVANELTIMRELFSVYPESTARYNPDSLKLPFQGMYGFGATSGPQWLEQRQFCVKNLRQLGLGQGITMEAILTHEANELVNCVVKNAPCGPIHFTDMLMKSTFNTIWTLITGETIGEDDASFSSVIKNFMEDLQYSHKTGLAFLPWLKYIVPEWSGYNALNKTGFEMNDYVRKCFERHQNKFLPGTVPTTLVEAFLARLATEKNPDSTFYGEDAFKHCLGSMVLLFWAGGESTASTLEWMLFYLCSHGNIQHKLQQEIDQVVGSGNVNLAHKLQMPYTEAVILESLRKSSFVPFGLVHELMDDLRFKEYKLQKGTLLIANIYHVHYNVDIWEDPQVFRPERFLESNSHVCLRDFVIPFQVGRRQCMAEQLARDILFVFVVKLLQRLNFTPDSNVTNLKDCMEPLDGFVLATKKLGINVKLR